MSNFMRRYLAQGSVDSSCVSPAPTHHYLGTFMPPGFEHLEGKRRGIDVLDSRPKMNKFDKTVFEVIAEVDANSGPIELING